MDTPIIESTVYIRDGNRSNSTHTQEEHTIYNAGRFRASRITKRFIFWHSPWNRSIDTAYRWRGADQKTSAGFFLFCQRESSKYGGRTGNTKARPFRATRKKSYLVFHRFGLSSLPDQRCIANRSRRNRKKKKSCECAAHAFLAIYRTRNPHPRRENRNLSILHALLLCLS